MVYLNSDGDFASTEKFLKRVMDIKWNNLLKSYAERGVDLLSMYTPKDTGLASSSWGYEIIKENGKVVIYWTNDDIENGFPVAIMVQYGHGVKGGGWVEGIDYINPALQPIFDEMANILWREVVRS